MGRNAMKMLGVILAVSMVGGFLSGCKKSGTATGESTTGAATTISIEVFDRGKTGQPDLNNNYWTKWINSNFGKKYNVNVQFVAVPRSQEVDKLNVLMAANQAPDLCFTYDAGVVYNYVSQGGLTQLDSYLSKYGQTLTKYLGKDVLKYGEFNSKQYSIPGKRTMLMNSNTFVRKDWLDKLGMKVPTTRDEFYDMLVAFRDKNPGNISGGCIPMVLANGSSSNVGTANLPDSFFTDFSEGTIAKATTGSAGLMGWAMPGYKDYMQFMNKLYNEKLISPDFAIDKTASQANADASSGKAGVIAANWDYIYRTTPGIYSALKKNVSSAEFVAVDAFKNTTNGKYMKMEYAENAAYMIIPKASKHAKEVVEYLNWMSDSKVTLAIQNGEEGVDYKMVNGVPTPTVPTTYTGDKFMGAACNGDYDMVHNGPETGNTANNLTAISYSYPGFESEAKAAAKIALNDAYTAFAFTIPNTAYAKYSQTLTDKGLQMTAKLITCKESDFSSLYDSQLKEYMAAGAQAVIDENIKNYKTQTGKTIK